MVALIILIINTLILISFWAFGLLASYRLTVLQTLTESYSDSYTVSYSDSYTESYTDSYSVLDVLDY